LRLQILLVEQPQRHAGPPQLDVDPRRIGLGPRVGHRRRRLPEQLAIEVVVAERVDRVPAVEPRNPRTLRAVARRTGAERERRRDLAMALPLLPLQSKNLSVFRMDSRSVGTALLSERRGSTVLVATQA
jgi:hypothetical protein